MGKFNKTGKRGMPELNTSSLPDLIFTMLFFFMIVTTMRWKRSLWFPLSISVSHCLNSRRKWVLKAVFS